MLYFAEPLADANNADLIKQLVIKEKENKDFKRGIKACTQAIMKGEKGLLVIAADISPSDLVSYLPPLAEEHNIEYVFINSMHDLKESNDYLKPTTCCFINNQRESKVIASIFKNMKENK